MGFLDFLRGPNMDSGLTQYRQTPGALLLDVRTPEEYAEGHIPGAQNLPLQSLQGIAAVAPAKDTPPLCLLSQRRPERTGHRPFAADGLHPCDQHRRHYALSRKGGTIR